MRWARDILSVRTYVYLLSLLIPLMLYDLALKAVSLYSAESPSLLGLLGSLRSDVLFGLGYTLLWVGLFMIFYRSRLSRAVLMVVLHSTVLILFVFTTAYYGYFMHTGSTLNYNSITVYLSEFSEIKAVVASQLHWYLEAFFVVALLYLIYGPWFICNITWSWLQKTRLSETT